MEIIYPLFNRVIMIDLFKANGDKVELMETDDYEVGTNVFKIGNLAIVFIKKDFTGSFTSLGGEYRLTLNNPFTFPIKFVDLPVIVSTTANVADYAYCSVVGVLRNLNGVSQITLGRPTAINNTTVGVQIIAIGKYK